MTHTLFIPVLTFLAGVLTLRAAERVWEKRTEAWEGKDDCPSLRRIQRYARAQYRIRMNIGISFLLFSGFWTAFVYYFGQERLYEAAVCLTVSVLLILWKVLWAAVDAVSSYIFLKKEDFLQIIAEEKEIIRKKLKEED
ncbi:MAG: hypothetical protein IJK97_02805 [Thermoguttaceae bacterium]|nr:hypothetical protein [Thermoguttaceae bacterium]